MLYCARGSDPRSYIYVKVEVAALGSLSLIGRRVSVDVKQHSTRTRGSLDFLVVFEMASDASDFVTLLL